MKWFIPVVVSAVLMMVLHFTFKLDEPLIHWLLGILGASWSAVIYFNEVIKKLVGD